MTAPEAWEDGGRMSPSFKQRSANMFRSLDLSLEGGSSIFWWEGRVEDDLGHVFGDGELM
jgi:hypothetical protein